LKAGLFSVTSGPFVTPSSSFALRAAEAEWEKFWSNRPPPGWHDLMTLIKRRVLKAEGDLQIFMANLRYFKEALAKLRPRERRHERGIRADRRPLHASRTVRARASDLS
jgi:hypothetical protein